MDAVKKSAGRQLADMLAAYGAGILSGHPALGYADWVSLWLNVPRINQQRAVAVAEGLGVAHSDSDLDPSWADAIAGVEEQLEFLHYIINAERQTARVRAKLGFPEPG